MGAGSSAQGKPGRQAAYLKYDLFKEKTDELARDTKRVTGELGDLQQELRDKLEDLANKQEELEDLTAQSFSKVKDVLTKSEKEVRGLRSEVSHASACLGKMGGAVKRARGGAQTSEERLIQLEEANEKLMKRVLTAENGLDALGKGSLVDLKVVADAQQTRLDTLELDLGSESAKHTIKLHSQRDEITELAKFVKNKFGTDGSSDDGSGGGFGADYAGFGLKTNTKLSEVDALFDALAARVTEAERRADLAEANAAEERKARERAEKIASDAADTASKAAAAAEVAADAAGASKMKRQEAEKRAREMWNKVTTAEEAQKTAEEHLMGDLQKARADLWPAARKRAAEDVMEKVKQEAALRAAEAIQRNMSEDADKAAADLERQEQEAEERASELAAAEAQFEQFREQLVRKIVNRMKANAMGEFFDKWIDMWQDGKKERGEIVEHPDYPDGDPNPPVTKTKTKPAAEPEPVAELAAGPEEEAAAAAAAEGEGEGEGGEELEKEEGAPEANVGATLEADPAEVLQQG